MLNKMKRHLFHDIETEVYKLDLFDNEEPDFKELKEDIIAQYQKYWVTAEQLIHSIIQISFISGPVKVIVQTVLFCVSCLTKHYLEEKRKKAESKLGFLNDYSLFCQTLWGPNSKSIHFFVRIFLSTLFVQSFSTCFDLWDLK